MATILSLQNVGIYQDGEQKVLSENPELDENVLNSKVRFVYEITLPSRPEVLLEYEISEGFMLEDLVAKVG